MTIVISCTQDEKALYDAAERGDVSTVRRLIASHVNVNCTPYGVGGTQNCVRKYSLHVTIVHVVMGYKGHLLWQRKYGTKIDDVSKECN